ncbi:MAG TPA: GNAT family N-acetyltransferase [Pelomicrobium sp.]|nr:GNAT family N-acetyltransferase [Pelomicrobium sp.]
MEIVEITSESGDLVRPDLLAAAERVHRQLRSALESDYAAHLTRIFGQGARMLVAQEKGGVAGVAVFRVYENTSDGPRLYVDDLVTDEARRSGGVGGALLDRLEAEARRRGCTVLVLDSGTQRTAAHRFYFRQGMVITSFNFKKRLK